MEWSKVLADKLMRLDSNAWRKLDIGSGGELYSSLSLQKKYVAEVTKFASPLKGNILKNSDKIHDLIEYENYHSLNNTLALLGFYGKRKQQQYISLYDGASKSSMNPSAFPNLSISTESVRGENRVIENLIRREVMKQLSEAPSKNIPRVQKLVDEVNKLIASAIDSDGDPIYVVDSSSTWEEPMTYKPVEYKNGRLKFSYTEPYSGNKVKTDIVNVRDIESEGIATLRYVMKMYKRAIKKMS